MLASLSLDTQGEQNLYFRGRHSLLFDGAQQSSLSYSPVVTGKVRQGFSHSAPYTEGEKLPTQRDMMRRLYSENNGDEVRTIAAYAKAERNREVERRSNDWQWPAERYALALLRDGQQKGWLTKTSSQ